MDFTAQGVYILGLPRHIPTVNILIRSVCERLGNTSREAPETLFLVYGYIETGLRLHLYGFTAYYVLGRIVRSRPDSRYRHWGWRDWVHVLAVVCCLYHICEGTGNQGGGNLGGFVTFSWVAEGGMIPIEFRIAQEFVPSNLPNQGRLF